MRLARNICRRTPPDGEWGHYESRWFGYRLKYVGPCREFHLGEPGPGVESPVDCHDPNEDVYDDDDDGTFDDEEED
jgi:hypothetical protein